MRDTQTFLLPKGPGIGYPFGVIATPDVSTYDELHGPFATYGQAISYIAHLKAKYSQYTAFRVVKIETPGAPLPCPRCGKDAHLFTDEKCEVSP